MTESTMTVEARLERVNTELPLGQRLLQAGFKAITRKEIEKRFSCETYNKKFIEEKNKEMEGRGYTDRKQSSNSAEAVFIKYLRPKLHIHYGKILAASWAVNILYFVAVAGLVRFNDSFAFGFLGLLVTVVSAVWICADVQYQDRKYVTYPECFPASIKLSQYISDAIPERCTDNIALAKKLGVKENSMKVYYPKVTHGIESDFTDPIIVAQMGKDNMVEIDCWE